MGRKKQIREKLKSEDKFRDLRDVYEEETGIKAFEKVNGVFRLTEDYSHWLEYIIVDIIT